MDVLSNLPFAIAGLWGLQLLARVSGHGLQGAQRACASLFFVGLLTTTAGSTLYHLAPSDTSLVFDRLGMSVAFAGLLALAVSARISDRAGLTAAAVMLLAGPASVLYWMRTGDVLAWAVVQFGGIVLLLLVLALGRDRAGALPVHWSLVLLAYAVAKLLESNDALVLHATGGLLSGHTLKHVAAAFSALPVVLALLALAQRQNGRSPAAQAA
jgi:hypothetical protein